MNERKCSECVLTVVGLITAAIPWIKVKFGR